MAFAGFSGLLAAATLPPGDSEKHLGVATCASSFCHGAAEPGDSSQVLQDEYLTWQRSDPHSNAYATLSSEDSREIVRRMGMGDATREPLCLSCHADSAADTGERFRLDDGVGCEACHGGAERWIESHAVTGRDHAENLAAGLYPLEDPAARAALCQSCHVGDADRPMHHDLLGAGHPPLLFELDTFGAILPKHYRIDADYRERKPVATPVDFWLAGQLEMAARYLAELERQGDGHWPEFSLYTCQSCHHDIDSDPGRPRQPRRVGLPTLRSAPLDMLSITAGVLASGDAGRFDTAVAAMVENPESRQEMLTRLRAGLDRLRMALDGTSVERQAWRELLLAVTDIETLVRGRQGREVVDQRVMSVAVLLQEGRERQWLAAADAAALDDLVDHSYSLLADPYDFNAYAARLSLQALHERIEKMR